MLRVQRLKHQNLHFKYALNYQDLPMQERKARTKHEGLNLDTS